MLSRCHNIIVHAVAVNEHRRQFHGRSIFNNQAQANQYNNKALNSTHYLELGFLGAHSDIGGFELGVHKILAIYPPCHH